MATYETFSKRSKRQAGVQDVYQYDDLPQPFRVQVCHIWTSALGMRLFSDFRMTTVSHNLWRIIHDTLARELGVFTLQSGSSENPTKCRDFLLGASTDHALDIIELSFRVIDRMARTVSDYERQKAGITQIPDDAVEELNARFREHAIGYQYSDGLLIRVDSEYLHSDAVLPTIHALSELEFTGAFDEFMNAQRHYREGKVKEAIVEALKAYESTMKAICDARGWSYSPAGAAKELVEVIFANKLLPADLTSSFTSLRALLETGLPTLRNRRAGHGQGSRPVTVPDYFAAYALHLAASNILLLAQAHKNAP